MTASPRDSARPRAPAGTIRHARRAWPAIALGVWLAAAAATVIAPRPVAAEQASQSQIESDLTCQCGCGLTVHSCNHLNCSSGIPLKQEIAAEIATGNSREEILLHFEKKYGEKILAAPTTHGFNIAAWTVPFVAIGLGGIVVAVVVTRWRRAGGVPPQAAGAGTGASPTTDPALRARLESALEDYERRS